jgi:hypothetical protein
LTKRKAKPKEEGVSSEGGRHHERRDEQGPHSQEQGGEHGVLVRVDRVGQPGVSRPRPPERAEQEHGASEPVPGRVVGEISRDLGEPEHEHQVEERLEGRDSLLVLLVLLVNLAHTRTLTRVGPMGRPSNSPPPAVSRWWVLSTTVF